MKKLQIISLMAIVLLMCGCVSTKQYRMIKAQTIGYEQSIVKYKKETIVLTKEKENLLRKVDSLSLIVDSLQVELDNIE